MTWTETNRRQEVLREVREIADARRDGVLPWSDAYADVYAGPDDLVRDLAYRWRVQVEAQVDTNLDEDALEDRWADLHRLYGGVLRILDAHTPRRSDHELAA